MDQRVRESSRRRGAPGESLTIGSSLDRSPFYHSVEDCLYKAKWGIEAHVALLKEQGLPVPKENPNPRIVIQNQEPMARTA